MIPPDCAHPITAACAADAVPRNAGRGSRPTAARPGSTARPALGAPAPITSPAIPLKTHATMPDVERCTRAREFRNCAGGALCARIAGVPAASLPGVAGRGFSQPEEASVWKRLFAGCGNPASPIRLVEVVGDRLVHLREQVAVAVVGLLDRGV